MSNENRPKKSWREIDRSRESGTSRSNAPPRRDAGDERQAKQYKAALEALFNGGGLGTLADKLSPLPLRPLPSGVGMPPGSAMPAPGEAPEGIEGLDDAPPAEAPTVVTAAPEAAPAPSGKGKKRPADDKATLRRKVLEAAGRHEITRAVERYLERFPLPEDHEFLEQLLEHEKDPRVLEGMEHIAALLDRGQPPKRSRALCGKLRYLQDTTGNEDLRERARALLQRL